MLYVCAGLRATWETLHSESSRGAVALAEWAADGAADYEEIAAARYCAEAPTFGFDFDASYVGNYIRRHGIDSDVARLIEMGVYTEADVLSGALLGDPDKVKQLRVAAGIAYGLLCMPTDGFDRYMRTRVSDQENWPGAWLVRELFGNPFRPTTIAPAWRTRKVLDMARMAYDERQFGHLPILADALEDAGCDAADLLAHCRGPGPHALGCWALDAALGKST